MSIVKYQGIDTKDLSNALKIEFARGSTKMLNFKLTAPISASVKHIDGQYRKVSFVGNEEFRVFSSYMGKVKGIIITFAPKSPVNYAQMELPLELAITAMDPNFKRLIDTVVDKLSDEGEAVSEAVQKNKQAFENESRARLLADPRYGAW